MFRPTMPCHQVLPYGQLILIERRHLDTDLSLSAQVECNDVC
jgi:hypothetical protein